MSDPITRLNAALEGRYRVERELGEGGMATVYLADDLRHERRVAVKVLKPELAAIVGAERFLAEIKTTANLQHPHILPLFDSGEADGFLFYVMPYVEGESLRERLDREKQLPIEEAVSLAAKVSSALHAAHAQGVIHRDIKPANILLAQGEPLVADFGIALALQHAGGGRLTETGLSLGTPHYMSPEQAAADRDPDPRSDVYSLGCVLYEMLTGDPPHSASTAQAVVAKILTEQPTRPIELRATIPVALEAVVLTAVHKMPADRFGSAADFADALRDPAKATALVAAASAAMPSDESRKVATRFLPWAVAGAATLAAVGFALRSPTATAPPQEEPTRFSLGLTASDVRAAGMLAISPDGQDIVFLGSSRGRTRLYRRSLSATEVTPFDGTEDAFFLTISPDGRSVAYTTPAGEIMRVPMGGGRPVRVATVPDPPIGMSWSADETLVMGMLAYNGDYSGLTRVDMAADTELEVVTETTDMHHFPFALEGGTHVLYQDFSRAASTPVGLGVASLADGRTRRLDFTDAQIDVVVGVAEDVLLYRTMDGPLMAVLWDGDARNAVGEPVEVPGVPSQIDWAALAADGTLVMARGAEEFDAVVVNDRGETMQTLSGDGIDAFYPRFSPDGRRAALAASFEGEQELWIYELSTALLSQLPVGFPPYSVDWSDDGTRILATGSRARRGERPGQVWSRAYDASDDPALLLELPGRRVRGVSVSPTGGALAIMEDAGPNPAAARHDILVTDGTGDAEPQPFAAGAEDEAAARFSPDGTWLAYASDEAGRSQVYVRPFPGPGPRTQVSADGGGQPVWSQDGARLFFRTDRSLMAADLTVDPSTGALSVTDRRLLFEGDFFGGAGSPVATYDVHPDGDRFLIARAEGGRRGEIVVWKDWLGELRSLLGAGEGGR